MPSLPGTALGGAQAPAVPAFGRFTLLQPQGRSRRTRAWRVLDSSRARESVLLLPAEPPGDSREAQSWLQRVQRGMRLQHPNLAQALEAGSCNGWPFVQYALEDGRSLQQLLAEGALPAAQAAALAADALRALAYAHDGGVVHGDLQPYMLFVNDDGGLRLMGLGVGAAPDDSPAQAPATNFDALGLPTQRDAAKLDTLALGLILHHMLSGVAPLDEADVRSQIKRLTPRGNESVRLPWVLPRPVPEALRAIANRSTDRQGRRRYGSARTFESALRGWLQAEGEAGADPLALLLDRMRATGMLPAAPSAGERLSRLVAMDRRRTAELAEVVLQDLALAWELLRQANHARTHAAQGVSAPVLSVRRAIAMVGIDGLRRAAQALRPWPGPLPDEAAGALAQALSRATRAGDVAVTLRPPGYDAEVVRVVTLLQNLGRLLCRYHFPDEARQIERLAQGRSDADEAAPAGLGEADAARAVLGVDLETLGVAVARHWGLDEPALALLRRLPAGAPPRAPASDEAVVRAVASCANEAVDAMTCDALALERVVRRYARPLGIEPRELQRVLAMHVQRPRADSRAGRARAGVPNEATR